jgi:hypothetical protein
MFSRAVHVFLGTVLLAGVAKAEPPTHYDPTAEELKALLDEVKLLRAEVEVLRPRPRAPGAVAPNPSLAQVKELRQAVEALRKNVQIVGGKLDTPAVPIPSIRQNPDVPETDGDPRDPSGVVGRCWSQFVPGVPGQPFPEPALYEGAKLRLLSANGKEVIQEATANAFGEFRLAVPAGKYLLRAPDSGGAGYQLEVTVRPGKWTKVEITVSHLGV